MIALAYGYTTANNGGKMQLRIDYEIKRQTARGKTSTHDHAIDYNAPAILTYSDGIKYLRRWASHCVYDSVIIIHDINEIVDFNDGHGIDNFDQESLGKISNRLKGIVIKVLNGKVTFKRKKAC